ncbi:T9SS C-terminal target domain-containing protein [Marinilabiliaceae bacterium JC017]|nr:T9SS C-terminal target domain-containing protein [Marinilabiliaceae bacterium JC017]
MKGEILHRVSFKIVACFVLWSLSVHLTGTPNITWSGEDIAIDDCLMTWNDVDGNDECIEGNEFLIWPNAVKYGDEALLSSCPSQIDHGFSGMNDPFTIDVNEASQVENVTSSSSIGNGNDGLRQDGVLKEEKNGKLSTATGKSVTTWYAYKDGNWKDPAVWTTDPSGNQLINPLNSYPKSLDENIVIKTGRRVNMNWNSLTCGALTVEGGLDLGKTSGHTFTTISGSGRIIMAADNFPAGDATHFISKNQGEGTVVYRGGSYSISNPRTFCNVEVNLSKKANTLTLLKDFTVCGNLTIQKGNFKINDDSSEDILHIDVDGNVSVEANGKISTGRGNTKGKYKITRFAIEWKLPGSGNYHKIYHQFAIGGDFINRGSVRFTNESDPMYDQFSSKGGVTVRFDGEQDSKVSLYGTTDFYNLIVEKGTDKTHILEMYADNAAYFRLFGANKVGSNESGAFSEADPEVRKALWIYRGTLKLTGNIHIPTLTEGNLGDYAIGKNGRLWLAGDGVQVYSTTTSTIWGNKSNKALSLMGELKVSGGLFSTRNSAGIIYWPSSNATVNIEDGEVNVAQFRPGGRSGGKASYKQSGGTLIVRGNYGEEGEVTNDYPLFGLSGEDDVFMMSGGEIRIKDNSDVTFGSPNSYDFYIPSSEGNYNVTGGKVHIQLSDGETVGFKSTANVWDFEVSHLSDSEIQVDLHSELKVSNDLTINAKTFLNHRGYDVSIGRNFTIDAQATQDGNNYGYLYDANKPNTTTFNGTEDGTLYIGHPVEDDFEEYFWNVVVDKPAGKRLLIDSDSQKSALNVKTDYHAKIMRVENDLIINSGTLDQGEHAIRLYGPLTVNKNGKCGVYEHGTTHKDALIMFKDAGVRINTEKGAELGNIKMNPQPESEVITLTSDVKIGRISYWYGRINMGPYKLTVDYLHNQSSLDRFTGNGGNADTKMFYSDGKASNGGLSLFVPGDTQANSNIVFPIGVGRRYTPVTVNVANVPSSGGYITVTPVDDELRTTDLSGGHLLSYYWRVRNNGFSNQPKVKYQFRYHDDDVNGSEDAYVPGSVLAVAPFTRSRINLVSKVNTKINTITYDNGSNGRFPLVEANYTAGEPDRFVGAPGMYFSNANYKNWNDGTIWHKGSKNGPTGEVPTEGSIVYIYRDGASQGRVWGDGLLHTPAEIILQHNYSVYPKPDGENVPRLQFQTAGTYDLGKVSGTGMISFKLPEDIKLKGDFGDFGNNPDSYYLYFGGDGTITNIPVPIPNLMIEAGNKIIDQKITVNSDYIIQGRATVIQKKDVEIKRDLVVGFWSGGVLQFPGSGDEVAITVGRNIDFTQRTADGERSILVQNSSNRLNHRLIVKGDIIHGNNDDWQFDLFNGEGKPNVIFELQGDGNNHYNRSSNAVPEFYRIIMNKGNAQAETFIFNESFALRGSTVNRDKALELQNGTLVLNHPAIKINLTTGNDPFPIPASAALEVRQGSVRASGNSGINLDGKLSITGGVVDMSGGDNPIVYSASGDATLEVKDGSLTVGSQIRRDTGSEIGVLNYSQTGGSVVVGSDAAPVNERGVFEVLGTGSEFNHTGGSLHIARAQDVPSIAALYLDPEKNNVRGSTITIGDAATNGHQEIGIYSTIPLGNMEVNNASGKKPVAKQWVVPLTLSGDLTIQPGATFDANGLDLYVGGNFSNTGTFTHHNNTTYLNGLSAQIMSGNTTFYNLVKSGTNNLVLTASSTSLDIDNKFEFKGGVLKSNDNKIQIQGHCVFDGTHISGGADKGIVLNGTGPAQQTISGNGTLGVLTINNPAGVTVPLGNQLSINRALRLQAGVFNIDKNLLVLNVDCDVVPVNDFSATNMIQTNISFTDNGVKKYLPAGVSSFVYPMGSGNKYTPVTWNVTANDNSNGYIIVKPANEYHPSVEDPANVLQYHWVLKAGDISGFSANMRMKYDPADVSVTGSNSISKYITARLLFNKEGEWNKNRGTGVIDVDNHELLFDFTVTDNNGISGDYTAGIDEAIPDKVPTYISKDNGNWTNAAVWDTYPEGGGVVPPGGPRGTLVIINHEITLTDNSISSYRTTINDGGMLKVGTTYGHRLGEVLGTGTLYLESGRLPAGIYDDFASPTGGTFEFGGADNYNFLSDITSVNNLILSGTGERRFPNLDLQLYGDLEIFRVKAINEHDRTLLLKKNLIYDGASFDAGTGSKAKVIFNGHTVQNISGTKSLTGTNAFNHFQVNNPAGVTVNTNIDIRNNLYLTDGVIYNTHGKVFTINNTSHDAVIGGGVDAYVEGTLSKRINRGDRFTFPVGDKQRYGQLSVSNTNTSGNALWEVEYFNYDPGVDNYNRDDLCDPVEYVSSNEYWRVKGPAAAKAVLTLRWDKHSGFTPDGDFRIVEWINSSPRQWHEKAICDLVGTASSGTVSLANPMNFNAFNFGNIVTFGSTYIGMTSWIGNTTDWHLSSNWMNGKVPSEGDDVTISSAPTGGNFPEVNASAQINNLTLEAASKMTIGAGIDFTIHGDLKNDGLFIVQTEVDNMTSVITQGIISGSGKEEIDFSFTPRWWWYVGHGVTDVSSTTYNAMDGSQMLLYEYDTSIHNWSQIKQNGIPFNKPLKGYHMNYKDPTTIKYTGHLHNGDYNSEPLQAGWQLVANPYVSYVDLDLERTNPNSSWTFTNIPKFVYMRTKVGTERVAIVYDIEDPLASSLEASQYLAPMQAFWVKSWGDGHYGVKKSARTHTPKQRGLKSAVVTPNNIFRLTLANAYTYDYAAVIFNKDGTVTFTTNDAVKLENSKKNSVRISQLYTLKSEKKIVINRLPEIEEGTDVPLFITVGEQAVGEQSLKLINNNDFNVDIPVVLEDLVTGEKVNLRAIPEYNFMSDAVTDQQRFILHFEKEGDVPTAIDNNSEDEVLVYGNHGKVVIDLSENLFNGKEVNVELYTLSGKTVYTGELAGTHMEQRVPRTSAFYIVNLRGEQKVISRKVFVK